MAPSVVIIIEHNADISFVYNMQEEENSSHEKSGKKLEWYTKNQAWAFTNIKDEKSLFEGYYNKHWTAVYYDLITPPPEA